MKAIIEIEDIDENTFTIRSTYSDDGVYSDMSPSHREVWDIMQELKERFKSKGFKFE